MQFFKIGKVFKCVTGQKIVFDAAILQMKSNFIDVKTKLWSTKNYEEPKLKIKFRSKLFLPGLILNFLSSNSNKG